MNLEKLLMFDARMSTRLRVAEKPGLLRAIATVLAHSGDSWFCLSGMALIWLFGSGIWRWRSTILVIATLITATLVLGLKFLVRRPRPEGEWGNIYRQTDPHSFPSGHAARTAMLATLAVGLGPAWFGAVLVAWAPLVSLARVAMGVHYFSDVVAGIGVGVLMGAMLQLVFL